MKTLHSYLFKKSEAAGCNYPNFCSKIVIPVLRDADNIEGIEKIGETATTKEKIDLQAIYFTIPAPDTWEQNNKLEIWPTTNTN